MNDNKKETMDKLIADYLAQSIQLEIYKEFFGDLPMKLANKCEQIAITELMKIEDGELIGSDKLIDWRQKVMLECTKEARKYRAELMAEYGIDEAKLAVALTEAEDDEPPKGGFN